MHTKGWRAQDTKIECVRNIVDLQYFSTDSLTLFCFLALEFVYKMMSQISYSVSKFSGVRKKTEVVLKRLFSDAFPNI